MKAGFVIAALLAANAASAQTPQQHSVGLQAGQSVIFSLDATGDILPPRLAKDDAPSATEFRAELKVTDADSTLIITNGTNAFYSYKARIIVGDKPPQPTSVCTIMSNGRMGIEHWPYKVRIVELAMFKKVPDGQMSCQ